MPRPTFLNLPDEKRNRIIELALDEFSSHPYRQASLSRIVSRAGIAKGSMYQYFGNKLDLYRWLVTEVLDDRHREWLQTQTFAVQGPGLFANLEGLLRAQLGFMLAHPRLAHLATNVVEPTGDEALRPLHGALRRQYLDRLHGWIREAQLANEIRSNVDVRALACFIDAVVIRGTTNLLLDRLGIEFHELLDGESHHSLGDTECRLLIEQAMSVLETGIGVARTETRAAKPGTEPELRPVQHAQTN